MEPDALIHRYLLGEATKAEVNELDRLLAADPGLRRALILEARTDAGLREIALERMAEPSASEKKTVSPIFRPMAWIAIAAAVVLTAALTWTQVSQPNSVATLVSNENAAWESALPTMPGSELNPGLLKLKSGVATIRFHSGAELILEAPAELELIDRLRAKLLSGAAVIEAPESAKGFIIETPNGYAVDYGTQFAVRVNTKEQTSDFELIEGEIAVHHPQSGDEVRLVDQGRTASVSERAMVVTDVNAEESPVEDPTNILRLRTNGRLGSVRRNPLIKTRPEILVARRSNSGRHNAHSFFAFDLSSVDWSQAESAQLRLNLVPSAAGFAARLPRINRFAVYGLTNAAKANWKSNGAWDDAPQPDDGVLLGYFEIPRSQKRGSFSVRSDELLEFLKARQDGVATLILTRETTFIAGAGKGLTHTFASDSHPEATGPALEFSIKNTPADAR